MATMGLLRQHMGTLTVTLLIRILITHRMDTLPIILTLRHRHLHLTLTMDTILIPVMAMFRRLSRLVPLP